MTTRNDGYMNLLSGLRAPGLDRTVMGNGAGGTGWRGSNLTRFWGGRGALWDYGELYQGNGLAQKIVDRPADDALQRGVELAGDDDGLMADEYDRLGVLEKLTNALRWSRLFGGAALVLIARDGGELTEELNLDHLDEVEEVRVYDATCLAAPVAYGNGNGNGPYGRLEYYTVTPPGVASFDLHASRLIAVGGEPLPPNRQQAMGLSWVGRPVLESCAEDLLRYSQGLDWSLRLLERKQQAVYSMEGLGQLFADANEELVARRINMVDLIRGNLNSLVVDKNDGFTVQNLALDGIAQILDEYQISLAASSNIPLVILFGKSVVGLSAAAKGPLESYYSMVSHIQQTIVRPALEQLTSILWVQRALRGRVPDTWHIEFNPLWMPSELEQAQQKKEQSTAATNTIANLLLLMNNSILTPEEVRSVVVNDIYSEYGFPDAAQSGGGDVDYAAGVDLSRLGR